MSGAEEGAWARAWDPMVAAVGTDLADGTTRWGADAVEAGAIRRYLEPLELGDPIHYDRDAARGAGFDDLVVPASAVPSFALPPMWRPGDPALFDSAERDAQPARTPILGQDGDLAPPTAGLFATDLELDLVRPVVVGERLGARGRRLLSCTPKQTSIGRGAFLTTESDIVSDRGDVVARMRVSVYAYDPLPTGADAGTGRGDARDAAAAPWFRETGAAAGLGSAVVNAEGGRSGRIRVGDALAPVEFALPLYRLVMAAGGNRDFNSIHHNSAFAQRTGAPEAYANTLFLMGMWERVVRDWAGSTARLTAIRGFRMTRFNLIGRSILVTAEVTSIDPRTGLVTVGVSSSDADGRTVGPGEIDVDLNGQI